MNSYRGIDNQHYGISRVVSPYRLILWLVLICGFHLAVLNTFAKPPIRTDNPTEFFTNISTRLLKSELNLDLNHIELYPTNQYTPAVHRLLQVAANLYDCITNRPISGYPHLPSVFRPLFARETTTNGTVIFISGFIEVTNAVAMSDPELIWHKLSDVAAGESADSSDMFYGVPLIIGAKTGLPNFNEFQMQTEVRVSRRLEFQRSSATGRVNETNQMFTLSISNVFGVEAWNSYSNEYPRALEMHVSVEMTAVLTNELGEVLLSNSVVRATQPPLIIPASNWRGWLNPNYGQPSFVIPFWSPTNSFNFLSKSVYNFESRQLTPDVGMPFERLPPERSIIVPRWWLTLQTRLRYLLVDVDVQPNRLVDFVNLEGGCDQFDITSLLMSGGSCSNAFTSDGRDGSMWCTNRFGGDDESKPTFGILNQIGVGLDMVRPQNWNGFENCSFQGFDRNMAIDFFRSQFGLAAHYDPGPQFSKSNVFYAPFAPVRSIYISTSWQANDPLVHYTVPELTTFPDRFITNRIYFYTVWGTNSMGSINKRYEPWGGNPMGGPTSPTRVNPGCKDPMVLKSSDWLFPTNQPVAPNWLGRVHRGTPWQTLYLKSPAIDYGGWYKWLGTVNPIDAERMQPIHDWSVVSLLASLFNTNDERQLLSVNRAGIADYEAAMDGFLVYTNVSYNRMEPMLISSNSPQAATIATAIKRIQTIIPGGRFNNLGEVFYTPELSLASPFISTNYPLWSLTDQGYEAIPSQLLSVLRTDPFLAPISKGDPARLRLTGMEGSEYVLQVSSNLFDWVSVFTNILDNGAIEWAPPDSQSLEPKYFRANLK